MSQQYRAASHAKMMLHVHNLMLSETHSLFAVLFHGSLRSGLQLNSLGSDLFCRGQIGTIVCSVSPQPFIYPGKLQIVQHWAMCQSRFA